MTFYFHQGSQFALNPSVLNSRNLKISHCLRLCALLLSLGYKICLVGEACGGRVPSTNLRGITEKTFSWEETLKGLQGVIFFISFPVALSLRDRRRVQSRPKHAWIFRDHKQESKILTVFFS